jgi:hypothetical protein
MMQPPPKNSHTHVQIVWFIAKSVKASVGANLRFEEAKLKSETKWL